MVLVAGATRGAVCGIAVALGETIEETAQLVSDAGGRGIAVAADPRSWSASTEAGRLDVLVSDIRGGERLFEWETPVWEHDLDAGAARLHRARTHAGPAARR